MKIFLYQTQYGSVKETHYDHSYNYRVTYEWYFKGTKYEIVHDLVKGMTLNGIPCDYDCMQIVGSITSKNAECQKRGFELAASIPSRQPLTHEEHIHKILYTPYTPEQQRQREERAKLEKQKKAKDEKFDRIFISIIGIIALGLIGYIIFQLWWFFVGDNYFNGPFAAVNTPGDFWIPTIIFIFITLYILAALIDIFK